MLRSKNFNSNVLTKINSMIPSHKAKDEGWATERTKKREKLIWSSKSTKAQLTGLHKIQMQFFPLSSIIVYLFPNLRILLELLKLYQQLNENVKNQTTIPILSEQIVKRASCRYFYSKNKGTSTTREGKTSYKVQNYKSYNISNPRPIAFEKLKVENPG